MRHHYTGSSILLKSNQQWSNGYVVLFSTGKMHGFRYQEEGIEMTLLIFTSGDFIGYICFFPHNSGFCSQDTLISKWEALTLGNKAIIPRVPYTYRPNCLGSLCQETIEKRSHHRGNGNWLWSSVESGATVTQRGQKNMFATFWSTEMNLVFVFLMLKVTGEVKQPGQRKAWLPGIQTT